MLVLYATSHGSTRGVAERLAARLLARGLPAEARAVTERVDVAGYAAVVVGSAVHGGKWLPEAAGFVAANAAVLRQRPVWLFSVSTLGDEESMFRPGVARRLRGARGETPEIASLRSSLAARGHRNFAGAIARTDWPATGRAFFRAMGGRYGDHRNWAAIEAWADGIVAELAAGAVGVAAGR